MLSTKTQQYVTNFAAEIVISAGEHRTIVTDTIPSTDFNIEADANLTFIAFLKKGWEGKRTCNFNFVGKGAEANVIVICLGTDSEVFEFDTNSNHIATNTNAEYSVRAALFDQSTIDYKGNIIIPPTGQQTNVDLAHHTLILSENAIAKTVPSLEIEADDVKAGHAATAGKFDEELVFYLESRGIERKVAEGMMVRGFMEKDVLAIDDEGVRDKIVGEVEEVLEKI